MDRQSYREAVAQTVRHLAARWAKADKQILRQVFPLLAEGRPVPVRRISEATRVAPSVVEAALDSGRAERDEEGRVVELSGLMLSPTLHRVMIGDVALFSCCALLAELVPAFIERPVSVESVDPVSRHVVKLVITPKGVAEVKPEEAVGSFVVTEARSMAVNVNAAFCRHVHHFASYESAKAFVGLDHRRYAIAIGDLYDAAQMLYREAWAQ